MLPLLLLRECMYKLMAACMYKLMADMHVQVNGCMHVQVNGWMHVQVNGCIHGYSQANEWRTYPWKLVAVCLHMRESIYACCGTSKQAGCGLWTMPMHIRTQHTCLPCIPPKNNKNTHYGQHTTNKHNTHTISKTHNIQHLSLLKETIKTSFPIHQHTYNQNE